MKSILKWTSFAFALLVIGFSIYGFTATLTMNVDDFMPDTIPILTVVWIFIALGSLLICIGAFKENKTLVIAGAIIFIVGVVVLFITRGLNIRYMYNNF